VTESTIMEWIEFMQLQGIRRVLAVMNHEELAFYATPLLETYRKHFSKVDHVLLSARDSLSKTLKALKDAEEMQEPIVVHCSTGQGRTAIVLAIWVHHRYQTSVEVAVDETILHSRECGATRKPTVESVLKVRTTYLHHTHTNPSAR